MSSSSSSSPKQKLLKLKKEELKEEARKRFLPVHGNKIDLVLCKRHFVALKSPAPA